MIMSVQMTNGKTHIVDGEDIFSNAESFANAICGNNLLKISVNYIKDINGEILLTRHIVSIKDQK